MSFLILGLLLRLAPLGRYVTPDEPAWVYRAVRFSDALTAGDWAAVPATGHPGVTTMWLGALGITASRAAAPAESAAHLDWIRNLAWLAPENGEAFRHLAFFLPWGRTAVALTSVLGLAVLYPLLARAFDRRIALLATGLLAFDPYLAGHAGLLHVDALLATFTLLALAAALNGLREPDRAAWWALSGLFTGLALLTKTPAVLLIPCVLVLQIIALFSKLKMTNDKRQTGNAKLVILSFFIFHFSFFMLTTVLTFLALYPALWADPAATLNTLLSFAGRHVEMAQRAVLFVGVMRYDPGPLFYPVVLLIRASPITLAVLAAGLARVRRLPPDRRAAFLALLAFALAFGVMMSLGVKKHDRYLLPALPPLTLAAALGIDRLVDWCVGNWGSSKLVNWCLGKHTNLPIYLTTALQALLALVFLFHPLTYASPLVGGPWIGCRLIDLDWGEGTGEAARWLNQQPDAAQLTVATDAVPALASLFAGRTVPLEQATLADYIALPVFQTSRPPPPIAHTVRINLADQTAVYTNTAPIEQAAFLTARAGPGDLILLDANLPLARRYAGPGTLVSLADLPTQAAISVRIVELADGRARLWVIADPNASPITAAHVCRAVEAVATPISGDAVGAAIITQYTVRSPLPAPLTAHRASFGNRLTLVDAHLSTSAISPATIAVFLRWQVPAPTPTDLRFSLYLVDQDGHQWAEAGQLLLDAFTFSTTHWAPGAWTDQHLDLKPPARIPPGTYSVRLTVSDAAGAQQGAWDAAGTFLGVRVTLGQVQIEPPVDPAGPPSCSGRTLEAGPLTVCAPEPLVLSVPSGDALAVPLTWFAGVPLRADYHVRWRLAAAGSAVLEQVQPLSPYPTLRWRQGDSFDASYRLRADPGVPAGVYDLALNVLDPAMVPIWPEDQVLGSVEILHRDRSFELPGDIQHPLELTLGGATGPPVPARVHLRGFSLGGTEAAPGATLPLTLYWQAEGPTEIGYTVFVHLVGPDGQNHGQLDYIPGNGAGAGAAPTTSWAAGQVIVDDLALPIDADAPAGTYRIAIGMYDAASGGRLPIADAAGQRLPDDRAFLPVEIAIGGGL